MSIKLDFIENILPEESYNVGSGGKKILVKFYEENLGWSHFYEGQPLSQYIGVLVASSYISEKNKLDFLIEVLKVGTPDEIIKTFIALYNLFPKHSQTERLTRNWQTAKNWRDVIVDDTFGKNKKVWDVDIDYDETEGIHVTQLDAVQKILAMLIEHYLRREGEQSDSDSIHQLINKSQPSKTLEKFEREPSILDNWFVDEKVKTKKPSKPKIKIKPTPGKKKKLNIPKSRINK